MGIALTKLLVELADPKVRAELKADPEKFLAGWDLSALERDAVKSGDLSLLWRHARSVPDAGPEQQFNRLDHRSSDLLIEIDPVVEIHVEHNSLTAAYPEGMRQTIVGEDGLLYDVADASDVREKASRTNK
jgi:hypothetical protein